MKEDKITLGTIAEILNVSPITISRALTGQPGVGEELRESIIKKAKELGYKNKKLKDKNYHSMEILVLVKHHFTNDNSNFSYMVQGIEHYIKKYGADFTIEFVEKEKQDAMILPYNLTKTNKGNKSSKFDGVIVLGKFSDNYLWFIQKRIKNMVVLNSYSYEVDCDYVYFNYNRIGYKAAKYLVGKGHREIGFIGMKRYFNESQKFLGFSKALERYHIDMVDDYLIDGWNQMEDQLGALIESKHLPTAVICKSDNMALRVIKQLHDSGIRVPEDVSVVGIGNIEMSSISIPALTTFDLNINDAAEAAVRLLMNRLEQKDRPFRTIYINTMLVERQSVKNLNQEDEPINAII